MAATRLSDSQKEQIVARYRQGETGQALAEAFGCSPNTVSRVVKAALDPGELASLKRQRGRTAAPAPEPVQALLETADLEPVDVEGPTAEVPTVAVLQITGFDADRANPSVGSEPTGGPEGATEAVDVTDDEEDTDPESGSHLAIDDADDFGDEALDEGDDDELDAVFIPVAVVPGVVRDGAAQRPTASVQPLAAAALPARLYLLVDKTVELQAQPLADFPELGSLPEGEAERQALMLFTNPREAKRQCGRTQRVIPVPDPRLLERTASYLVSQGITRLVLEGGALYSLPGA
ncbi:helix-turn-helix domain-containing protein [Vulcanococcus limneticus]|uniref:helix-turn-helix domain-containing protein n=1 Tax=Vulcanococcus limneticus TaxID=2170428 RepID=UPI00398BDFD6